MVADKKTFASGVLLLALFLAVLVLVFLPLFSGQNGLIFMDNLYNSISKASAFHIPDLREEAAAFSGEQIRFTLVLDGMHDWEKIRLLFMKNGADTGQPEERVIFGDLREILSGCLDDSEAMYGNHGEPVREKYGFHGKEVLYAWWVALELMDKKLTRDRRYRAAGFVSDIRTKAVETAYNYYGITAEKIGDRMIVVVLSLLFYVAYTLLYGFAVMLLFKGWGMQLEH